MPTDLYIPPDALEVFLEAFEGPLDLLLYLIRKQNFNISTSRWRRSRAVPGLRRADPPDTTSSSRREYLLMAAMLIEIKSRMLLPPRRRPTAPKPKIRAPSWCAACSSTSR
jgi:segregation and condensation protein A